MRHHSLGNRLLLLTRGLPFNFRMKFGHTLLQHTGDLKGRNVLYSTITVHAAHEVSGVLLTFFLPEIIVVRACGILALKRR